jgi:hypothetical protein
MNHLLLWEILLLVTAKPTPSLFLPTQNYVIWNRNLELWFDLAQRP